MKHSIIVTVTNGATAIRGALLAQKTKAFIIQVLDEDASGVELTLERPQWQVKHIEHTYKGA